MRITIPFFAAATLLAACAHEPETDASTFTVAEPTLAPAPPITRYADADRDGRVTRDEARRADPVLAQNFDRFDLDRNDALDRGEFARLEAASRSRHGAWSAPSPARGEPMSDAQPGSRPGDSLNRSGPGRSGDGTGAP